MVNTGHGMKLVVDETSSSYVNVSGGPLSYQYRVYELHFHFAAEDNQGSEHMIDGRMLPMEIQIFAYNEIYQNASKALSSFSGLVAISIFAKVRSRKFSHSHTHTGTCRY